MGSRHPARRRSDVGLHLVANAGLRPEAEGRPRARSFRRYPLWRVLGLDAFAVAHYLLGCAALLVAWRAEPVIAWPLGLAYFVFATTQLFVLKPLLICPGCVYRTLHGGRCPSALNLLSARLGPPAPAALEFQRRSLGCGCQTNLALCSWLLPLPVALTGLILDPSRTSALLVAALGASVPLRWLVDRSGVCPHCLARRWCSAARVRRPT